VLNTTEVETGERVALSNLELFSALFPHLRTLAFRSIRIRSEEPIPAATPAARGAVAIVEPRLDVPAAARRRA
jgi:hypothetical protein